VRGDWPGDDLAGPGDLEQVGQDRVHPLYLTLDHPEVIGRVPLEGARVLKVFDARLDAAERVAHLVREAAGKTPQSREGVEVADLVFERDYVRAIFEDAYRTANRPVRHAERSQVDTHGKRWRVPARAVDQSLRAKRRASLDEGPRDRRASRGKNDEFIEAPVRHVFVAKEFAGASVRVPDSPLAVGAHESVQHRVQELLPAGLHHLQPIAEATEGEDRAERPRQRFQQVREALRVGFVHDPNGQHAADRIVRTSRARAPPPVLFGHFGSIAPRAAGAVEKALVDTGFRRRGIEQRKGDPTAIRGEIGP
jgi:hypothetical protein